MIIKSDKCSCNRLKILIVDDIFHNIQLIEGILKEQGFQMDYAQDGYTAMEKAFSDGFDLILLDILMPFPDGFEICRQLKSNPKTKDIPIIFLSGRKEKEDIVKGFELGAVDYITKPFHASELLARVKTHLELRTKTQKLKMQNELITRISNERKELLHVLCHDLINSIAAIRNMLDLPPDSSKYEKRKQMISSAIENAMNLIGFVRNFRALHDRSLELEPVNLSEAIFESHLLLINRFTEKNIDLSIDIDDDIFVYVEKTSFINSVLNNIFTNAIKFSYPDSQICVKSKKIDTEVEISIRDFGVGIPQFLIPNIFKLDKVKTRVGTSGEIGTGFGMSLIKKFINAYGGRIEIHSVDEKENTGCRGTEVVLILKAGNITA